MELWGLTPDTLLQVFDSALHFYMHQKGVEVQYHKHRSAHAQEKLTQQRANAQTTEQQMQREHKELRRLQSAYQELQEAYSEKSRQCKKHQEMVCGCICKHIYMSRVLCCVMICAPV
jgi:uncharacterized protein (DUF3084 family)